LFIGQGLVLLFRIRAQGDGGWDGLISGIALGLGILTSVAASGIIYAAHLAFRGWVRQQQKPVALIGLVFTVIGATAPFPAIFNPYRTPLDHYLIIARLVLLGFGLAMMAAARRFANERDPEKVE
jgi:4-amino-4-deoxy-L-arabinose transferase-like glycosyltransferase